METKEKVMAAMFSLFLIYLTGTGFYYYNEDWSLVDSAYFSAMTLTTVGYGDLVPTTQQTKLFTIAFAFVGIAVAFYTLAEFGKFYVESRLDARLVRELHARRPRLRKKVRKE